VPFSDEVSMGVFLSMLLLSFSARAEDAGGTAAYEQAGTLGPTEKAKFADDAQSEIAGHVTHVQGLLQEAQKEHMQDAQECISRKLDPMLRLQASATQNATLLSAALKSAGQEDPDPYFRLIAVALDKTREFRTEADACIGDAGADRGHSVTSMSEPDAFVDVESLIDDPWEEDDNIERDPSPN